MSCNSLFELSIVLSKQTTTLDFQSHDGEALKCRSKSCHWDVADRPLEVVCGSSYVMHQGHDRSTLETFPADWKCSRQAKDRQT